MKNIIIYSQNKSKKINDILKQNENYSITVNLPDEIKNMENLNPDLIIFDTPQEVTKNILVRQKFWTPVIIVDNDIYSDVSVRAEAYDYISRPIKEDEIKLRVANLLKIKDLKEEIKLVSSTDELTGLYNRKYLHERLESELSRAKRYNIPLSCLLIDIDFFKTVNDIYGYDWGDVLLKKIAEVIKSFARKEDIVTRYGDEEFIVILPNTDEKNTYVFAQRIREEVENMEFKPDEDEERHPVTISGGVAGYPFQAEIDETAQTLIRYSEHSLYNAKRQGKNKIVLFSEINLDV